MVPKTTFEPFTVTKPQNCKVLFLRGELFRRKWQLRGNESRTTENGCITFTGCSPFENLESLDRLKWHFQSFLYLFSQGPTRKRQNKSLVRQKHAADFVGFC
jgi:hypothetical protein